MKKWYRKAKERKFRFKGLAKRIISAEIWIAVLIVLVSSVIFYNALLSSGRKVATDHVKTENQHIASRIETILYQMETVLSTMETDDQLVFYVEKLKDNSISHYEKTIIQREFSIYIANYEIKYNNINNYPIIIFMDNETSYLSLDTANNEEILDLIRESDGFREFRAGNKDLYITEALGEKTEEYPFYIYALCKRCNIGGETGIMIAVADFSQIEVIFGMKTSENYLILDAYNNIVYPKETGGFSIPQDILTELTDYYNYMEPPTVSRDGFTYFIQETKLGGWKIIRNLTDNELFASYMSLYWTEIFIFICAIMILMASTLLLINRKLRPLSTLFSNMKRIANGDLNTQVVIKTGDEIEELSNSLDWMLKKVQRQFAEIMEKEETGRRMQYSLMISQLDPHFIYNTMHTITVLAMQERNNDIVQVNNALIKILKDTLRVTLGDNFETVSHEVDMGETYIVIQKYRYSDQFEVEWDIDPETKDILIPRNMIQPLVENAIFHGLMGGKKGNELFAGDYIYINIRKYNDALEILVYDNGVGITAERLEELKAGVQQDKDDSHVTLANIKYRLHYLYGEDAVLDIRSKLGAGTQVKIKLSISGKIETQ